MRGRIPEMEGPKPLRVYVCRSCDKRQQVYSARPWFCNECLAPLSIDGK